MSPPPSASAAGFARPHVDCTTSYAWPIVDTAFTAYQLAGVAYVSTLDEARFAHYPLSKTEDMLVGGALAAAYAGSAIYGYVSAARCRRIKNGPPSTDYMPGVSHAPFSRHSRAVAAPVSASWRLLSDPGGSEMWRRPDPKGAAVEETTEL